MKLLLDECLPVALRHSFPGHEVHSVDWAGFKGMKNGRLLQAAEAGGYEAFITIDQGIPHQQNSANRRISVLVLCASTNKVEDLVPLVSAVEAELAILRQGSVVFVR